VIGNLNVGESLTVVTSTRPQAEIDGKLAYDRRLQYVNSLSDSQDDEFVQALKIAADQFIVKRPTASNPDSYSILAGYPWFGDWGRDTMISLAGLTLATKRFSIARSILLTFAQFVDEGMLPNRFPDAGETPEYNTVDATLWYFEAIYQYYLATHDRELIVELYPLLEEIVQFHEKGTRYGIGEDTHDGLLRAGESGVQLTWMDAKVGEWVVTPRIGKPIEVNALWFNALKIMEVLAQEVHKSSDLWRCKSARVQESYQRFWSEELGFCFDVLDTPQGDDPSLRPNQIFAVSLSFSPLNNYQARSLLTACAKELLTSFGLRSLSPSDPNYQGQYGGGVLQRDGAYHQGTVWGWLLGHFAVAHFRSFGDHALAQSFLLPMMHHLSIHGLGTMSEIFDGDAPHTPKGCYAQAWTVAEVLRSWQILSNHKGA
jgi:predicted glycogen debranching enzyme